MIEGNDMIGFLLLQPSINSTLNILTGYHLFPASADTLEPEIKKTRLSLSKIEISIIVYLLSPICKHPMCRLGSPHLIGNPLTLVLL